MRIALIGYGRMGQALGALAVERGHEVCTIVRSAESQEGSALTAERMGGAEVALEFTRPDAAPDNLMRLARLRVPVVTGTTGWLNRLNDVRREVTDHGSALLHSANFSVGVQLFLRAAGDLAARLRGREDYAGYILEQHHVAKRDAPSGTALELQNRVSTRDARREFPITSVRAGSTPGSHALAYDSPHELIRLEHVARGRQAFASGALLAAEWLRDRQGMFTFEEMLFGEEP